ncbi:hypothetical protein PoB_000154900 [Plakobranchus ocellatus]|uniref:Uncharacterized protein n=1 Tax=Plakobranchus ocellatus TaxID=259542 RepID=A0AAV3XVZ1_9GAST|nr:hypothetical protein PoB_000154900 [Plakobranchus ocellatus]
MCETPRTQTPMGVKSRTSSDSKHRRRQIPMALRIEHPWAVSTHTGCYGAESRPPFDSKHRRESNILYHALIVIWGRESSIIYHALIVIWGRESNILYLALIVIWGRESNILG